MSSQPLSSQLLGVVCREPPPRNDCNEQSGDTGATENALPSWDRCPSSAASEQARNYGVTFPHKKHKVLEPEMPADSLLCFRNGSLLSQAGDFPFV